MATAPDGDLKSVSLVLTKDQIQRMNALLKSRKTSFSRISKSDIAREVVEVGLDTICFDRNTENHASVSPDSEAA
ncbi:MAG: hypothetical protein ACR2OE_10280 [Thermomicrobiales bacterium]